MVLRFSFVYVLLTSAPKTSSPSQCLKKNPDLYSHGFIGLNNKLLFFNCYCSDYEAASGDAENEETEKETEAGVEAG